MTMRLIDGEKRKEKPLAVCACCGKAFQKTTNAKRCPDCREEKRARKTAMCARCGKAFQKTNGNMRYCPQCREKKRTRKIAECEECGRSFTKANGNMHYCPQCKEKRSLKKQPAKKRAPALTLAQICKAAREAGMTYGKYVAMIEHNKD